MNDEEKAKFVLNLAKKNPHSVGGNEFITTSEKMLKKGEFILSRGYSLLSLKCSIGEKHADYLLAVNTIKNG